MSDCNCHSDTIILDGSGQLQRYLAALDPSFAPIDGRSLEDLLVFAKRYAAQIRFYDLPEHKLPLPADSTKTNWKEFFRRDMAVIAASIGLVDLNAIEREYAQVSEQLLTHATPSLFAALFNPILGMAQRLDKWYSIAIADNPLHNDLELAITSNLKDQLTKARAYAAGYAIINPLHPLTLDTNSFENTDLWGLNEAITPDPSIYDNADPAKRLIDASLVISDIFNAFFATLQDLVTVKAQKYLEFALTAYPAHQPHMALFIAFLEIFRHAQDQMNGITGRMLDYYYKDVLQLTPKSSIPDKAYVVFSLAKDVAEYAIADGTTLKGGKDDSGKDLIYHTTKEIVANRASVAALKTIFIDKTKDSVNGVPTDLIKGIYARPIANSGDGFGAEFSDTVKKWPTFGIGHSISPSSEVYSAPWCRDAIAAVPPETENTQIGFAVASPQLLLQSGARLIYWRLPAFGQLFASQAAIEIWLSGEKTWVQATRASADDEKTLIPLLDAFLKDGFNDPVTVNTATYYYRPEETAIYLYIPASEQAIVNFDAKLHAPYSFATSHPVMRLMVGSAVGLSTKFFKDLCYTGTDDKNNSLEQSLYVRVGSMRQPSQSTTGTSTNSTFPETPDGLTPVVVQTDNGIQAINKPFDPFTAYPQPNKTFYIGSEEIFNKPVNQLAVRLDHVLEPTSNQYQVSVLYRKQWLDFITNGRDGQIPNGIPSLELQSDFLSKPVSSISKVARLEAKTTMINPVVLDRLNPITVTQWDPQSTGGFIRILNANQNDGDGPTMMVRSQDKAPVLQMKSVSISYYSKLEKLQIGIDQCFHITPFGSVEISPVTQLSTDKTISTENVAMFSQADEKGNYLLVDAKDRLLPQFIYSSPYSDFSNAPFTCQTLGSYLHPTVHPKTGINQYTGAPLVSTSANPIVQEEGMLLIGIANATALQTLSLLFEFADGTAKDEDSDDTPEIHWSYLTNNEWRPFPHESIMSDGTYGFQTTGIVEIEIPSDFTTTDTIVSGGYCWIMASVSKGTDTIPQLIDIVAQAVEVEFEDNGNAQSHFDAALPAGSITKLVSPISQISKITQPFESFDGKHEEIGSEFYTRVSERLRHKDRAITPWDYEHLVLDRFPSIYRVKCITHTDPDCLCRTHVDKTGCCGSQVAPGHVLMVPISDFKNRTSGDRLQPKTSRKVMLEIEEYLEERTSPFVHVHVKNPVYEQILVAFRVQFNSGVDRGYYLKALNQEIIEYLTPWAFDEQADVGFGRKVYASNIIRFIEGRWYVDFITDFTMCVCTSSCCPPAAADPCDDTVTLTNAMGMADGCDSWESLLKKYGNFEGEVVASPSTSRSILVSAPQHIILPYEEVYVLTACEKRKLAAEGKGTDATLITASAMTNISKAMVADAMIARKPTAVAVTASASKPVASEVATPVKAAAKKATVKKTISNKKTK